MRWHGAHPYLPRALLGAIAAAGAVTHTGVRVRHALIVLQLGMSLTLLYGAGLLLNSFIRLTTVSIGFSKADAIAVGVRLPYKKYNSERAIRFYERLWKKFEPCPECLTQVRRITCRCWPSVCLTRSPQPDALPPALKAMARHVEPGYFRVLGIPIKAGREFRRGDDACSPIPALISVEAARRLFGGERGALGGTLRTKYRSRPELAVIGVASNVRQLGLREDPGPQTYLPMKIRRRFACYLPMREAIHLDPAAALRDE